MKYWNAINHIPEIGPLRFKRLIEHFNTMEEVWKADPEKLLSLGLGEKVVLKFVSFRKKIDPDRKMQELEKREINLINIKDKGYPPLLKEIYAPPPLLYYKGRLPKKNEILIAVVGSRKFSFYGERSTKKIVSGLTRRGISIVSGLALGIDTIAHRACLNNKGGNFAILGCGLDQTYPASNARLAQQIIQEGGVISEYPPGMPSRKQNFHARNRIISGLSQGVVVIEAHSRSGTFITANHALEQGRDVFVVPGEIFNASSRGSNRLIQSGAKLITGVCDILEEINVPPEKQIKRKLLKPVARSESQEKILENLSPQPISFDKLVYLTKLKTDVLLSGLTELEIQGFVGGNNGNYYKKN